MNHKTYWVLKIEHELYGTKRTDFISKWIKSEFIETVVFKQSMSFLPDNVLFAWFRSFAKIFIARIVSYSHDIESFERDWMARNMYHRYDSEAHKNLSHKQAVLFYGNLCTMWHGPCQNLWIWSRENAETTAAHHRIWNAFEILKNLNRVYSFLMFYF